jgi:hypothetical protein
MRIRFQDDIVVISFTVLHLECYDIPIVVKVARLKLVLDP